MIKILWIGGWDSTFRISQLYLKTDEIIQLYYILDEDRDSTGTEIKTMDKIKRMLYVKKSEDTSRIKDTVYIRKEEDIRTV